MDGNVIAALITAGVSAIVAVVAAFIAAAGQRRVTELQHALDRQARHDEQQFALLQQREERRYAELERQKERQLEAREELDHYREPLLEAATGLLFRVDNIRYRAFLTYLSGWNEHRKTIALLGTSYRLARYLAVVEALRRSVNLLRFERAQDTKVVNDLLEQISSTLSSDGVDGHRLMIWRDEQRAIGELTLAASGEASDRLDGVSVIGFARFVELHAEVFASWLAGFEADLQNDGVASSPRLEKLHELLEQLVDELTRGRRAPVTAPAAPPV